MKQIKQNKRTGPKKDYYFIYQDITITSYKQNKTRSLEQYQVNAQSYINRIELQLNNLDLIII